MASTSYARPFTLLQFPSPPVASSVDQFPPLRPRSPSTGHYRPFSTFYSEPPTEPPPEPRLRSPTRRTSSSALPSFGNMGFGFKDKAKDQPRSAKATDSATSNDIQTGRSLNPVASSPRRPSGRPSTSHGLFMLHKHRGKGLKNKRSLASLLSSNPDGTTPGAPSSESPGSTSPSPSSRSLDENETINSPEARPADDIPDGFVRKNTWIKRENMKVHPYPFEAAYMQAYDPILLENDRYTDVLLRRLNPAESPSFHDYSSKSPSHILDLGCGQGHWILEASNYWKNSHITGFDLVDILLPDLYNADNIRFVRGNFLKYQLPFADKSFDLVRMANLSLCIPYNKWEFVFAEVQRVLAIEGRLELIDDQIFFPYGPSPATPSAPTSEVGIGKGDSFFDLDDDFEEDEDTLEGDDIGDGDSMDTASTLNDTETSTPLSPETLKQTPTTKPHDTLPEFQRDILAPPSLADPEPITPTSATTITTNDTSTTARPSQWGLDVTASRNVETVFENMLNKKFGIHTRPSEFVLDVMNHVFGNGEKIKSYHLKLAPKDTYTGFGNASVISSGSGSGGSAEGVTDKEDKASLMSPESGLSLIRPWFSVEWDKLERKRLKLERKKAKAEKLNDGNRTAEESSVPSTYIPGGLSAKAAGRLGITNEHTSKSRPPSEPNGVKAAGHSPLATNGSLISEGTPKSSSPAAESFGVKTAGHLEWPTGPPPVSQTLSAKAAHRLGISYSALSVAAAASARPLSCLSSSSSMSLNSSKPSQSPGLIVWPSTYIQLSPSELEMHACKYVHTLLGCKPALAEFVEAFVDENGDRLASDEEFCQALWDYECFRRRRFNWPSEVPDWDSDLATDSPTEPTSTLYAPTHKPHSLRPSTAPGPDAPSSSPEDVSNWPSGPYTRDQLTHVRTLRIYESVKREDYSLSSLQFPRSPAPSPPASPNA